MVSANLNKVEKKMTPRMLHGVCIACELSCCYQLCAISYQAVINLVDQSGREKVRESDDCKSRFD